MEKLKSKSPYLFIVMAAVSFVVFYFRRKIRNMIMSDAKRAKMIQDAINEVRQEQQQKYSDEFLSMVKKNHKDTADQIMAFSKYGHKHR